MRKLILLLFFGASVFAQTTPPTPITAGTASEIRQFLGGVNVIKRFKLPNATSDAWTPESGCLRYNPSLGKLQAYNGSAWETYYPGAGGATLQSAMTAGSTATVSTPISITHGAAETYSNVSLTDGFWSISAVDAGISGNGTMIQSDLPLTIPPATEPEHAVRLDQLEAATTGIDLQGATDNGATTTNSITTGGYFTNDGTDTRLIADEVGALRTNVSMQFTNSGAEIGRHTLTSPGSDTILYTWQLPASDGTIALLSDITGGATNLSSTPSATDYTINSSTGTGAVISGATTSNAGALIASDKVKINALTTLSSTTPGTNVATFLTTPTSANLSAALTDETGTGAAVFGTSPTFTTSITTPVVATAATSGSTVGTSSIPYENVYTQNVYRPTGAMMIGTQASSSLGFATNSVSRWSIASGGVLAPVLNNTYTFGTSSLRPSIGYFVAGDFSSTVVASPATLSTELATLGQLTSYMHTLNTTTTALSSATLNSTYPNVTIFHTVHCPLIATGGINYIKRTEAGSSDVWDMVVTAVAP